MYKYTHPDFKIIIPNQVLLYNYLAWHQHSLYLNYPMVF